MQELSAPMGAQGENIMQSTNFFYFYGNESEQYTFYRIPKVLFTSEKYRKLSAEAKILYGLMLDRMGLSVKNNWLDTNNRVFIYFTLEDVQEFMGCKHEKACKIMAELDLETGVGLIQRVKQGQGRPSIIYIRNFIRDSDEKTEVKTSGKQKSRLPKNRSQDFRKTEVKTSEKQKLRLPKNRSQDFRKAEVKASEKQKSGLPKNRSQDFRKTEGNYNDSNKNYLNDIESVKSDHHDRLDEIAELEKIIKQNIEFSVFCDERRSDYGLVKVFISIMIDTILTRESIVHIAKEDKPHSVVKSTFLKLKYEHIDHALQQFKNVTEPITNKVNYIRTLLYNSALEMDAHNMNAYLSGTL